MLQLEGLWNESYCGPTHMDIKSMRVGIKQQAEEAAHRGGERGRWSGRSGDEGPVALLFLTLLPEICSLRSLQY